MLIRSVLGVAVISFGATVPAFSLNKFDSGSHSKKGEFVVEDEDWQDNPLMELDAERSYKSEALLSYKSTLAPYGKVVGIRTTAERTFTLVRTWKDVEEFIRRNSEERVIVKIWEPWGSELVTGVTVNRKSYPASNVRPIDPPKEVPARDPFEKTSEVPKASNLTPANSTIFVPSSEAKVGRVSLKADPLIAKPLAIEPNVPGSKPAPWSHGALSQYAFEATLLSLAIFRPHTIVVKTVNDPSTVIRRSGFKNVAIGFADSSRSQVKGTPGLDEGTWLQESIDLADRLGLLSAKPIVTSDRRQRAFAIYTLYMALKELRMQVDLEAQRLNAAMDRLSASQTPGEAEHGSIVRMARAYEQSMAGILQWDAEAMKSAVRGYSAELQGMDSARSMLSFLSRVKKQPEISIGYRAYIGGSDTQD